MSWTHPDPTCLGHAVMNRGVCRSPILCLITITIHFNISALLCVVGPIHHPHAALDWCSHQQEPTYQHQNHHCCHHNHHCHYPHYHQNRNLHKHHHHHIYPFETHPTSALLFRMGVPISTAFTIIIKTLIIINIIIIIILRPNPSLPCCSQRVMINCMIDNNQSSMANSVSRKLAINRNPL